MAVQHGGPVLCAGTKGSFKGNKKAIAFSLKQQVQHYTAARMGVDVLSCFNSSCHRSIMT